MRDEEPLSVGDALRDRLPSLAGVGQAMELQGFRFATSGFYGAITQAFRRVEPARAAAAAAIVVLPLVAHSLEFVVHWWRGTSVLGPSILASVLFTILSTTFNLFAMPHGALIVGRERRSLLCDLAMMPRLIVLFVTTAARSVVRA